MTENAKALTNLYETWRTPEPSLVGKLPKNGVYLDYLGHAEVTRALIEADPEWSWEPMAVNEQGLPVYRLYDGVTTWKDKQGNQHSRTDKMAELWIRLNILGSTVPGVGTCRADKPDLPKELISDALRNAAMRRGVALSLWSKQEWADAGIHSAEPGIKRTGAEQYLEEREANPEYAKAYEEAKKHTQTVDQLLDAFEGAAVENYDYTEDLEAPFDPPPSNVVPQSPAPESDRPQPAGAGTISDPQKRKLHVMLKNLGITDEEDQRVLVGNLLGQEPTHISSLDKPVASKVIDALGKLTADDFVEVGGNIRLVD